MLWKASLFFLLLVPILAYAEVGHDYDRIQLNEKTFQWTSHYPRIWDGSQWVNYLWSEDANIIKFDSANLSYELDKTDCSFKLYEPLTNNISIEKFNKTLKIDGVNSVLGPCQIESIDIIEDGLTITTKQGDNLKTIYELDARGFNEWTYEFSNTDLFDSKIFTITENCLKCEPIKTEGDIISLGIYYLDTKNEIHKSLKEIQSEKDLSLVYETKEIGFFDKGVIDPIFGYTATSYDAYVKTTDAIGAACPGAPYSILTPGNAFLYLYPSGSSGFCSRVALEFNITTIPDTAIPSDVSIRFDLTNDGGSPGTCNFYSAESQPSTLTASDMWTDARDGTTFVSGSTTCQSSGNDKIVDLGLGADSDLQNNLNLGQDWWAVYIAYTTETRDASGDTIDFIGGQSEIQITYIVPPPIEINTTIDLGNTGDVARISGNMLINNSTWGNLTSIKLIINGTTINTNSTGQNKTSIYEDMSVNFGPLWYQMTTDDIYNFTIQGTVQNTTTTESQIETEFLTREYGPDYFTASVASQGDVNYTFINNDFKVNRDLGTTFQIECFVQDWSNVFFATDEGTWYNQTGIGYFSQHLVASSDYYASCYNDDALFLAAPLYSNFSSYLAPAAFIFDALGGFLGAPAVLMFVLAIFSWGTGRNFPVVIVIGVAALGIMGAMSLIVMASEFWAVIFVLAGIGVFGVRKFF